MFLAVNRKTELLTECPHQLTQIKAAPLLFIFGDGGQFFTSLHTRRRNSAGKHESHIGDCWGLLKDYRLRLIILKYFSADEWSLHFRESFSGKEVDENYHRLPTCRRSVNERSKKAKLSSTILLSVRCVLVFFGGLPTVAIETPDRKVQIGIWFYLRLN